MPIRFPLALIAFLWSSVAFAQGVIPLALAQQSDANGRPLSGALLYIYQVGTVATPQNSFPDPGLTLSPNQWPLPADSTGRFPMFYLASGSVHVRMTDATGVVVFDILSMPVIGPSVAGGGGGGTSVDPTAIASTGDIKFRLTTETLAGWVKLNAQTIGDAMSGASGRATADTQALFSYLWQNCPDTHCPVIGGRLGTAALDYGAHHQLTLPDFRGRSPFGLDDMGAAAANRIAASNITSGGTDGPTTPLASGGTSIHTLSTAELAAHNHVLTDPGHKHGITSMRSATIGASGGSSNAWSPIAPTTTEFTDVGAGTFGGAVNGTGILIAPAGSSAPYNTMPPFILGTWHIRL